jgi:tyrosine-protein kinase Etk/Wzc
MDQNTLDSQRGPRELNLMDYFFVLWKWRRFIFINLLVAAVLISGATLLIPNRYKSVARLLPPKQRGGSSIPSSISQLAQNFLPLGTLRGLGASQDSYNYVAILQSYTSMERLIKKFNLAEVYDVSPRGSIERTMKELEDYVGFKIEEEGTITITVWDTDPKRAAGMANYLIEVLNDISLRLGTQEATDNRIFVEKRYVKVLSDLKATEDTLKKFQQKYGIYSLQEALSGKFLSSFVPLDKVPELTMDYIRLYRDLEIQNKILEFALPLYEQAKVDEQKDIPAVLVLDNAVPAEKKDTPKRMLLVGTSSLLVLILLAVYVFFVEALDARRKRLGLLEADKLSFGARLRKLYKVPE